MQKQLLLLLQQERVLLCCCRKPHSRTVHVSKQVRCTYTRLRGVPPHVTAAAAAGLLVYAGNLLQHSTPAAAAAISLRTHNLSAPRCSTSSRYKHTVLHTAAALLLLLLTSFFSLFRVSVRLSCCCCRGALLLLMLRL